MEKWLSIREAALTAGTSDRTLYRWIDYHSIYLRLRRRGRRTEIAEESCAVLTVIRGLYEAGETMQSVNALLGEKIPVDGSGINPLSGSVADSRQSCDDVASGVLFGGDNVAAISAAVTPDFVPLAAHLAALDLASRQIERLSTKTEHLEAQAERLQRQAVEATALAEAAHRQRLAMEYELKKYQLALADSAESLAEQRAMRLAAEAAKDQANAIKVMQEAVLALPASEMKVNTHSSQKGWSHRVKSWFRWDSTG